VKVGQQGCSCRNKDGPQDQGPENAPEEDSVLVDRRNCKVGENYQEDKKIIDTQGPLNHIAGQKFQRLFPTAEKINSYGKKQGQGNPDATPSQGLSQ
jgi:hypothetical protein